MNILYFIGNGFDLNLGLKTSYSDFLQYYKTIESVSPVVNKLKNAISKDLKTWADLELALGKYTENINSLEEFDDLFEDIANNLGDYLEKEEILFDYGKIDKTKLFKYLSFPENLLLKADNNKIKSFKSKWHNSQWIINIVTFNYTQSIEQYMGVKRESIQIGTHDNSTAILYHSIEHIHGFADDGMILGVNDISQIANKDMHKNRDVLEALVKNDCNQALKHTTDGLCKERVTASNLICIFGSSLGDTDKMWWNLIGEQLKRDDFRLIIYSIGEEIPLRFSYKKERKVREIKKIFLSKTKLNEEEKSKALDNIYVGINTGMFKLTKEPVSTLTAIQ